MHARRRAGDHADRLLVQVGQGCDFFPCGRFGRLLLGSRLLRGRLLGGLLRRFLGCFFLGHGGCLANSLLELARAVENVFEGFDGGVALGIIEIQNLLQRDADVGNVLFDVLALVEFALEALALADVHAQLAASLLQSPLDLRNDLVVGGDGLLGLGSEGHPDRGDVHHDGHGGYGHGSLGLGEAVGAPIGADDAFGDRATGLLVEQGHPVGKAQDAGGLIGIGDEFFGGPLRFGLFLDAAGVGQFQPHAPGLAVGDTHLDLEGVAAIDRGGAGGGHVEVRGQLLFQALEQQIFADGGDAVGGRGRNARGLDGLVQVTGLLFGRARGVGLGGQAMARLGDDALREGRAHAAEFLLEEARNRARVGLFEHGDQAAQLHAVGVGLDVDGLRGLGLRVALVDHLLPPRIHVGERQMRVRDGSLLEVHVHRTGALLVDGLHLDLDAGAMLASFPGRFFLRMDFRLVAQGVDGEHGFHRPAASGLRDDLDRLARSQLAVHARGRDADALLASTLAEFVEFGAVQELAEDLADLRVRDAGPVVLDAHQVMAVVDRADFDPHIGQDVGLFAGIQAVVHGFLDRHQDRLGGGVEPQHVPVLLEEFGDGNVTGLGSGLGLGRLLGLAFLFRHLGAGRRIVRPEEGFWIHGA